MPEEGLTIFAHLGPRETDMVVVRLVHAGLWDCSVMIYDCDSSLLMSITDRAKAVVLEVLAEIGLLPKGETTLHLPVP